VTHEVATAILRVLYLYGSAAHGRLTETSDFDLAVAAETALDLDTRLDLAVRLVQALGREVDLVDLQDVSGEIVRQSLCRGRKLLQRDEALHARLVKRLWFHEADMMPYIRRILAERRRRFVPGS
jgi:predicted nucleotidyltransferase